MSKRVNVPRLFAYDHGACLPTLYLPSEHVKIISPSSCAVASRKEH